MQLRKGKKEGSRGRLLAARKKKERGCGFYGKTILLEEKVEAALKIRRGGWRLSERGKRSLFGPQVFL